MVNHPPPSQKKKFSLNDMNLLVRLQSLNLGRDAHDPAIALGATAGLEDDGPAGHAQGRDLTQLFALAPVAGVFGATTITGARVRRAGLVVVVFGVAGTAAGYGRPGLQTAVDGAVVHLEVRLAQGAPDDETSHGVVVRRRHPRASRSARSPGPTTGATPGLRTAAGIGDATDRDAVLEIHPRQHVSAGMAAVDEREVRRRRCGRVLIQQVALRDQPAVDVAVSQVDRAESAQVAVRNLGTHAAAQRGLEEEQLTVT